MKILLTIPLLLVGMIPMAFAQSPDFGLVSSTDYVDVTGVYNIVGEIQNNSNHPVRFVEITATLYDSQNKVLGKSSGYALIDVMKSGEKSPFHLLFTNLADVHNIASYRLSVSSQATTDKPRSLEVAVGNGYTDINGMYHLVGEVTNKGDKTATFVEVDAAFYDSSGRVVDVASGYTNPENIQAGDKQSFELITLGPNSKLIKTASVNAESTEYANVPEFPLPVIGLLAGMVAVIAITRKRKMS